MSARESDLEPGRTGAVWIAVMVALIAGVLLVSLVILKPAMPDRIELLTGPAGSSYHEFGERLAAALEKRGLDAEVVVTTGGMENIERLAAGAEHTVALAPAGIEESAVDVDTSELISLGSVGYEPLWLFHRAELELDRLTDLAGHSVATYGTIGSYVLGRLLDLNGIREEVEIRSLDAAAGEPVVDPLASGQIDAVMLTGSASSGSIRALLTEESVVFLSFDRASAYVARLPGITSLVAPEGVFDLARNIPPEDSRLLSGATTLVTHEAIHPEVAPLVLEAVTRVTQQPTLFSTADTFPSREHVSLPLDAAARRYFDQGERGLSRFLPYQVTRFLNHLGFVVLPLLTAAFVLLKFLPVAMRTYGSMRLVGLFKKLEAVEKAHAAGGDRAGLLAELDRLDESSAGMFVPRPVVHDYVDFRQFLHDMRERVEGVGEGGGDGGG